MAATASLWATRTFTISAFARHHLTIPIKRPRYQFSSSWRFMASSASSDGGGEKITAPYGSWKSPISADVVSGAEKRLGGIAVAGDGRLVWIETRPSEAGMQLSWMNEVSADDLVLDVFCCQIKIYQVNRGTRYLSCSVTNTVDPRPISSPDFPTDLQSGDFAPLRRAVLVKEPVKLDDEPIDVIPSEFAARTLAQEYGGGAFAVSENMVIFSNYKDQRLYKQFIGDNLPVPLTPDYGGPAVCYADGVFDPHFNRYVTVMEDHRQSNLNPVTTIVAIEAKDGTVQEPKVLVSGNDFYAFPRIDPNGKRMAWIEWSHPSMHWDKAELWVGYFSEDGGICKRVCVAGGDHTVVESPTEPKWSSKGELFFVTDRKSGFWNIHKWIEHENEVEAVYSLNAEFTRPLWVFGICSYDFVEKDGKNHNIVCSYRQNGRSYLGILDYDQGSFSLLDIPFTDISNIVSGCSCFYIEGASATHPLSIAKVTLDESQSKATGFSIIWSSSPELTKYRSYFSLPEIIEFPTEIPGQNAYAYFYPPSNHTYKASLDEKPPLLVKSHGGPTSETRGILDLSIQYWTSRGWGFVDVNYGGSTGYGREYRERLLGRWGIVDVNDCCSCARFLVESGKVDGQRLCITGRSAGGYTTLACLAFRDTFRVGASLYGVADLSSLKAETHKFESHYIDNLVGSENAFYERSPINFADRFTCPVILFQGLDDKIVPPDQARKIYLALKEKGLPVALIEYEGEQHGFRKAENIKFTLEQQMVFFARLVGHFQVADEISPIKIDNYD